METLVLRRVHSDPGVTLGAIFRGDEEQCKTLERPWAENAPRVSCIPAGRYPVRLFRSPARNRAVGGKVFLLENVPGRNMIEIHTANVASELEGCIAVGSKYGEIGGHPAVLFSQRTMVRILEAWPEQFMLEVRDAVV